MSVEADIVRALRSGKRMACEDAVMEELNISNKAEVVFALGSLLQCGAIAPATDDEPYIRLVDESRWLDTLELRPVRGSEVEQDGKRYVWLRKLSDQGAECIRGSLVDGSFASGGKARIAKGFSVLSGALPGGQWHEKRALREGVAARQKGVA